MRTLLPFLACLMLILISWSGMAHAVEAASGSDAGYDFSYHAPGDGDEAPADADSGLPHHHGACHNHDLGTMQMTVEQPIADSDGQIFGFKGASPLHSADDNVMPRPPRT
ncbi:hypothetical protein [Novosphingobium sp. fls2-241-R2A-195]|jgi:hypothetical protein|uniref:hypothetical protein n=1 Tax=Novosphingobium sp. fls2-241-R2A-195 TaxID=3040296 RepID=UPI00254B678F|nr:hypothetical protein [Novosphingobium sp. fls2-241-R2A-195]